MRLHSFRQCLGLPRYVLNDSNDQIEDAVGGGDHIDAGTRRPDAIDYLPVPYGASGEASAVELEHGGESSFGSSECFFKRLRGLHPNKHVALERTGPIAQRDLDETFRQLRAVKNLVAQYVQKIRFLLPED